MNKYKKALLILLKEFREYNLDYKFGKARLDFIGFDEKAYYMESKSYLNLYMRLANVYINQVNKGL